MNYDEVLAVLREAGAVLTHDHFVYTKGGHGSEYVNKDAIFAYPDLADPLAQELAIRFRESDLPVEVVAAPAVAGAILAQSVARHLWEQTGRRVHAVYADRGADGKLVFRRGYDRFLKDREVLVVEDILNTGGSAKETVEAVRSCGGTVRVVAALVNRGGVTPEDLGVSDLITLLDVKMEVHPEAECPLCQANVPVNTEVGHGAEFLRRKVARAPGS